MGERAQKKPRVPNMTLQGAYECIGAEVCSHELGLFSEVCQADVRIEETNSI
jgi:hypothetical protein